MFLAAAPYFQYRFRSNEWILNNFQAAQISVSCATSLTSMLILSKLQKNASYPKRISTALVINIVVFTVLALSTLFQASGTAYFAFLLVAVFAASLSTGLIQNGLFAFTSGFGRSEYTQAIMTGQGIAGVLPPLTQIISVLAFTRSGKGADSVNDSPTSAMVYFLTATGVSVLALLAFFYILRRKLRSDATQFAKHAASHGNADGDYLAAAAGNVASNEGEERPSVPLKTLFMRLPFLATGVFMCFTVTMLGFPVFTAAITSNGNIDNAIFIPLAFLVWNLGDLAGRLSTLSPKVSLTHWPFAVFCIAMARFVFIPLYFLCNIKGRGAIVNSDAFYLIVVQFLYGLSNGYVGSECMIGAGDWVAAEEREAAGGFMGLMLVAGLTAGSVLSFAFGNV